MVVHSFFPSCFGLLLVVLTLAGQLQAFEDKRMEQAQIYFDAEGYQRAVATYENLLSTEKEAWKRSILEYNIATVFLEEGNLEEAVKRYSAIPLGKEPFPLLVVSIKTNMAIARWRGAKKIVQKMVSGKSYFEEDYMKAIFMLNQALIDLREASKAHCKQLSDEGDKICSPSYSLNKLRDALQQQLALVEVEHLKKSLKMMTPKNGVPLILAGIYAIKQEILQIMSISMPVETEKEQKKRVLEQALTWEPLWNALGERSDGDKLFFNAKDDFFDFIDYLQESDFEKSLAAIKSAEKNLNDYMGVLYDQNSVLEFLKKLIVSYEKAELMVPLQEAQISSINDQQKTILTILKKKSVDTSVLEDSIKYLDVAIEYAKKGKFKSARVYLTTAYQLVKRFKWTVEIQGKPTVEQFLGQLINEQMASIVVNYSIIQLDAGEEVKDSGLDVRAQEVTMALASNFWELAIEEQKDDYSKPLDENEKNQTRCQYQPWTQVVELYDRGYTEAQKAMNILMGGEDNHPGLIHQDAAMRYWREALEKLKNTPPQESCQMASQAPESKQEEQNEQDSQQQEQQQQKQPTSMDDVLRLLQKMEQQDRQKKGKTGKVRVLEDKAW